MKSNIKRIEESQNNLPSNPKKENSNLENLNITEPQQIIPSYNIKRMETEIKIKNDKTYGQVTENVKFILKNGLFTSIIRKISLAGSSDSIIAFKVSSK